MKKAKWVAEAVRKVAHKAVGAAAEVTKRLKLLLEIKKQGESNLCHRKLSQKTPQVQGLHQIGEYSMFPGA